MENYNKNLAKPNTVSIELTDKCPLFCPQCYKNPHNNTILLKKVMKLLDEITMMNIPKVTITGGEPFIYPNILDVIKKLEMSKLYYVITTSGYNFCTNEICEILKRSLYVEIHISLNGSSELINSYSRDGYQYAINAMKLCNENKINYRLNWVARKDNINDLRELISFAKKQGAKGIDILQNKPNKGYKHDSLLSNEENRELLEMIIEHKGFLRHQVCMTEITEMLLERDIKSNGCVAGSSFMIAFADGTFSMCPQIHYKNTFDSIMSYWIKDKKLINFRNNININKFRRCSLKKC